MNKIKLTRKNIELLMDITSHFKDIEVFTVEESSLSGIGATVTVTFDLFNRNDTKVDITDTDSW